MLNIVFDNRLFFPPVAEVRSVLDCGYGAASWAVEVAEKYPSCTVSLTSYPPIGSYSKKSQVIGVDISPHLRPDDLPENFIAQVRLETSSHRVSPFFLDVFDFSRMENELMHCCLA